jgi:glycosyltransferase involved in cell wall biosynthesis
MHGHESHVLVWGLPGSPAFQEVNSVQIHTVSRGYWPLVEKLKPGSREEFVRFSKAKHLDSKYHFDWIEIQSDEGIDIGIQRRYSGKTILRVHTTLAQMIEHKQISLTARTRAYLARERRSLLLARRILVSTAEHGKELMRLFPLQVSPTIVTQGFEIPAKLNHDDPARQFDEKPTFLVVGSLDRRKGSERIVPALEAYVRRYGPCRCVLVASNRNSSLNEFGFGSASSDIEFVWRSNLDDAALFDEYRRASALLHLARYESFGYPPVEAASMGRPVVATATGAAIDLLSNELGEFLIDGDNPIAVSDALALAVRRPEVGLVLKERYQSNYTKESMISSYLECLDAWRFDKLKTV